VLVGTLSLAFVLGRRDERMGAGAVLAAALATPLVQNRLFHGLELGILLVDLGLFLFLLTLALRSDRHWPMFAAGFQLTGALIHVFPGSMASLHPDAYADAAVVWAYPVLLSLLAGTLLERPDERAPG
jgi:hypothetical protein